MTCCTKIVRIKMFRRYVRGVVRVPSIYGKDTGKMCALWSQRLQFLELVPGSRSISCPFSGRPTRLYNSITSMIL